VETKKCFVMLFVSSFLEYTLEYLFVKRLLSLADKSLEQHRDLKQKIDFIETSVVESTALINESAISYNRMVEDLKMYSHFIESQCTDYSGAFFRTYFTSKSKIAIYFKQKFILKPQVSISIEAIKMKLGTASMNDPKLPFNMRFEFLKVERIDSTTKYFRFGISEQSDDSINTDPNKKNEVLLEVLNSLESIRICYVAFLDDTHGD